MKLTNPRVVVAAAVLLLSVGTSVAGAVSGPGANENSKFVYTEEIVPAGTADTGNLIVNFDEGGQKRFASVDYRLDAVVSAFFGCGCSPQVIGVQYTASQTLMGLAPDDARRVTGSMALDVQGGGGTLGETLLHIDYADVTLTNLVSGHIYRLDAISQDYRG